MTDNHEDWEGIAVIGIACRFPNAPDLTAFWDNLRNGRESIHFSSKAELRAAGLSEDLIENPNFVPAAVARQAVDQFDASFFNLSPREAQAMDPQFRFFLETAWHALEDAAQVNRDETVSVGVFAGSSFSSYLIHLATNPAFIQLMGQRQINLANDKDNLPMQTAYRLNLQGPSLNVQTGCTTALTVTHTACQYLLDYQCDVALAGAVSLSASSEPGYLYREGGTGSPDGHCRAFDAHAGGHIRGDGLGVLVLKRVEDAIEDGDRIYAVIKGSAVNNDGAGKVSYAAPGRAGQAKAALAALAAAEVDADQIGYLEAHGTGTRLGDVLEVTALMRAFRETTQRKHFCPMGSVKTNIGYLDAASGMPALIKTILALHHGEIPPSLNFQTPNPDIDFDNSPFFVNTKRRAWPRSETPRYAGVNGYSIGGANAFLVLKEAPQPKPATPPKQAAYPLCLSAKSAAALADAKNQLESWVAKHPNTCLADLAFTLQVARAPFDYRGFWVANNVNEVHHPFSQTGHVATSAELFCVYPAPGVHPLLGSLDTMEPDLAEEVRFCLTLLSEDDARELVERTDESPFSNRRLKNIWYFIVQCAATKKLLKLGIKPVAAAGHGLGLLTATWLAGGTSLQACLNLICQGIPMGDLNELQIPLFHAETGTPLCPQTTSKPTFWQDLITMQRGGETYEQTLAALPDRIALCIGEAPASSSTKMETEPDPNFEMVHLMPEGRKPEYSDWLHCLGALWIRGIEVNWQHLFHSEKRDILPLPGYPFQHQRYWVDAVASSANANLNTNLSIDNQRFSRPNLETEYVAPRSDTEKVIADLIGEQLGIDKVGVKDNFFELGGNSMTSILLSSRLGERFDASISPTLFLTTKSLADLAGAIDGLKSDPVAGTLQSPVVPLHATGKRPPIFMIHPIGGSIFVYKDLAKYTAADQPLYGLQALDLTKLQDTHGEFRDIAAFYVNAVLDTVQNGPFVLGGLSYGGHLAYEMSVQLQAMGKAPRSLIIGDSPAPIPLVLNLEETDDNAFLFGVAKDWAAAAGREPLDYSEEIQALPGDQQLDRLVTHLHKHKIISKDRGHDWLRRLVNGYHTRLRAFSQWKPEPYGGRTLLFRATRRDEGQLKTYPKAFRELKETALLGWDAFIPETEIETCFIEGYHATIGLGKNAQLMMAAIRQHMDA